MARKRMIDPDIWEDDKFKKLNYRQRLMYIGLISNADDEGKMNADPHIIRAKIFPFDDITVKEIEEELNIIANLKLIYLWENKGHQYLLHPNWQFYQKVNHPTPSKIPFPEHFPNISRTFPEPFPPKLSQYSLSKVSLSKVKATKTELNENSTTIATLTLKNSFIETKKQIYPMLDIEGEIRKCVDWHKTKGTKIKNWERAITNWLKIAYDRKGIIATKTEGYDFETIKKLKQGGIKVE